MRQRQTYSPTRSADNLYRTDIRDQPTTDSYLHAVDGSRYGYGCDYKPGLWDIQQPDPHKTVRYLQRHGDVGIVVDSCYYYTIFTIKSQVVKNPPKSDSMKQNAMWYYELKFKNGTTEYIKGKVNVLQRLGRTDWETIRICIQKKNGFIPRAKAIIRRMPKSFTL